MITKTHTKAINSLKELAKHKSITTIQNATRLMKIHTNEMANNICCTEHFERLEFVEALHNADHNIEE